MKFIAAISLLCCCDWGAARMNAPVSFSPFSCSFARRDASFQLASFIYVVFFFLPSLSLEIFTYLLHLALNGRADNRVSPSYWFLSVKSSNRLTHTQHSLTFFLFTHLYSWSIAAAVSMPSLPISAAHSRSHFFDGMWIVPKMTIVVVNAAKRRRNECQPIDKDNSEMHNARSPVHVELTLRSFSLLSIARFLYYPFRIGYCVCTTLRNASEWHAMHVAM